MSKRAIERWKRLKATGAGDGVIEVPSIDSTISTGFGTARYAIGEQGQPRLLVPVGGRGGLRGLTSTPKLMVNTSSFNISGKGVLFIDIMCQDRALDLVFAELAEEILRRIKEGHAPLNAVIASIDDFRELLKEGTRNEILDNKIQGLVGELEVLRHLTHYSITAIDSWTGPFEQRHDFRRGLCALEVKTSGRSDATKVSIHGLDQLAPPSGGTLYLAHVRLERVENGPLSVSSIFNSLVKQGVNTASLKKGLAAVECYDPHSTEWNRLTFTPEGITFYAVVDGFPRVIGPSFLTGSIPLGVAILEYQVDLTYAKSFELSTMNCGIALKRIAG
jgi:hypothetical protein